jgi:hypothetical protein
MKKANEISISIAELEAIVKAAKAKMTCDSNGILDIVAVEKSDSHSRGDRVEVFARSSWAECNSTFIYGKL